MEAIENRFEGNKESKKVRKTLLKQQYENFNRNSLEGLDQIYDRMQKLISQLEIHEETISQEDLNMKLLRSLTSEEDELKVADGNADNKSKEIYKEDSKESREDELKVADGNADNKSKEIYKEDRAYKAGLESVEAILDVCKKNEVVFEEDINILKLDIMFRDNALTELRNKFEKDKKERDDLKLTLEKFENSSKNLSKLLDSQVCDKFKTSVGYDSQVFDSKVFDSQVFDSQVNDKYKTGEGYHAVPPPYTGNFMPPKHDLILVDMDEYVISESVTSVPVVAIHEVKTSDIC
nr:hypothetical protein [Tanacetum cinerariifolium]